MTLSEPQNAAPAEATAEAALAIADRAAYSVKLPVFEGPLDLLLHLIRQNEMEITEIPVAVISAQYLEYLELMRMLDLDIAGEYLVMAATLALIKSRMLLPPDGEEDADEGLDPREELVQRLLEYQRYKEVAEELGRRRLLGRDVFSAQGAGLDPPPEADREIAVELFDLIEAFRQVLSAASRRVDTHHVEAETVRVRDRMVIVMDTLGKTDSIEFHRIFEEVDGGTASRAVVVATFLAILELARLRGLRIYQGTDDDGCPEGVIRLRKVEDDDPRSWGERLSESM